MHSAISITSIFINCICLISSKILISQNDATNLECFGVLSKLFKQKSIFYINPDEDVDDILKTFHKNENLITIFKLKQGQSEISFEEIIFYDVFIIQIKSLEDFTTFIEKLSNAEILNSKGKYLILNYGAGWYGDAILKVAWKYYLFYINIITITNNDIKIKSYLTYYNNECHKIIETSFKNCCEFEEFQSLEDLFPNEIPHDLKGCDTKYGVLVMPPFVVDAKNVNQDVRKVGLEVILFKTFLKLINSKENLTFVSDYEGLGTKYPNGTITGPLSNLKPNETDVVFGHLWPNMSFSKETDTLYPFYFDNTRWYVPKALQLAKWKCLFVILQAKLWALIFLVFIINAFVWWAIAKHTKDIQPLQNIGQCLLSSFYILCSGSSPLPNTFIMRFLVINWTLCGLLLAVMYQSQLLTILTTPSYEHQITDVAELPITKLRFLLAKDGLESVRNIPQELIDWILEKGDFVNLEYLMQKMIQYDRTFVFVSTYYWMKFVVGLYYTNPDGSQMVYDLYDEKYTALTFHVCTYTTKRFPLLDRFNEIGFRLHDSGFIAKWLRDIDSTFYGKVSKDPIRLSLDHVAGGFFLLACGLGVSLVMFFGEIVVFGFWGRKKVLFV